MNTPKTFGRFRISCKRNPNRAVELGVELFAQIVQCGSSYPSKYKSDVNNISWLDVLIRFIWSMRARFLD